MNQTECELCGKAGEGARKRSRWRGVEYQTSYTWEGGVEEVGGKRTTRTVRVERN